MEVTIYLDVLWLRSFLVEFLVCCSVNFLLRQDRPLWRVLWMCAACVSVEVLLFALAGFGVFAVGSIGLRLLLVTLLFRPDGPGIFLRILCWSLAVTVVTGGVMLLVRDRLPEPLWFPLGLVATGILLIAVIVLEEHRQIHEQEIYGIVLLYKEKALRVRGLRDTGNQLVDPYVHEAVHILARSEAESLGLDLKKSRLIPCATVGDTDGLLQVWTIDGMEWESRGQKKKRRPVVIGTGEDVLFRGKDYRLILSAAFDRL